MVKHTKCVTKIMTISGRKKRVLKYVNEKTKTERTLVVGPRAEFHTNLLMARREDM